MYNQPIDTGYPDPNQNYDRAKPVKNDMEGLIDTTVGIYGLLSKSLEEQAKKAEESGQKNKSLAKTMEQVNKVIVTTMTSFNAAANIFHAATTFMEKSIHNVAGSMMRFVEVASPASVTLFNYALRDMNAIIGYALLPLFQRFIGVVRMLGDFLATLDGNGKKFLVFLSGFGVGVTIGGVVLGTLVGIVVSSIAAFTGAAFAMISLSGATITFTTIITGGAILALQLLASALGLLAVGASGAAGGLGAVYFVMEDLEKIKTFLEPVLVKLAEVFNYLGAIIKEQALVSGPALIDIFKRISDAFIKVFGDKDFADMLVTASNAMVLVFELIIEYVFLMVRSMSDVFSFIAGFKLKGPEGAGGSLGDSKGAAVQNVGLGSVESFISQLRQNALMSGMSPEQSTAENTRKMSEELQMMNEGINKIRELLHSPEKLKESTMKILEWILEKLPGHIGEALVKSLRDALPG
jgi:hypothetical protein